MSIERLSDQEIYRFDPDRLEGIAKTVADISLKLVRGDRLFLTFDPEAAQLADIIDRIAQARGVEILPFKEDSRDIIPILKDIKDQGSDERTRAINQILEMPTRGVVWATKAVRLSSRDPHRWDEIDPAVLQQYRVAYKNATWPIISQKRWVKVDLPSVADATAANIPYPEYKEMILRACDRDWEAIKEAQSILIHKILNPGRRLNVYAGRLAGNRYRTHLSMSIEGQKFANSTVDVNIPGSEVYAGPVKKTLRGKLVLPSPTMLMGRLLPNLTLEFKKGEVIKSKIISKDPQFQQLIDRVLNTDEGAKQVGEFGLGLNWVLNRPIPNPSLIEKMGGSFHLALGDAYTDTEVEGEKVQIDNGVRSAIHEDLTCMMRLEFGGGLVLVDGKVIQQDGRFLDPDLEILNG